MTLSRRRFLTISAAMAATPAWAGQETWHGRAFGADVSLTIRGPREPAQAAIHTARQMLGEVEHLFSLFDETSTLSNLNENGHLLRPDPRFVTLMQAADQGFKQTKGLFDPSIQPLWKALASNAPTDVAKAAIGWDRVRFDSTQVTLDTNQALTFNGIAQGYATDLITEHLTSLGMTNTLVNIGEFRAIGGPFTLGLSDPTQGHLGNRSLQNNAIATSSPAGHIMHPTQVAQWSTVSVEATTATTADYLSTALCLAPFDQITEISKLPEVSRITLVDFDGNLTTI
ncbi:thiamine biosynthesis lipoprotein [Loktanella ponticola]|uniref:FAD:protein FMN transferase n=1 Tax=Yoonia ponticola TaxID=1524255 RepID=A0A7W9BL08_9RHOB|nr:FAD:protein FMN transferase [Yoonia ponticola]MBB5722360.1 thiamine biosynthesis lipoprotein [Yoonia ponticola]